MAGSATTTISTLIGLVVAMATTFVPQAEARAFFVFGDSLVDNGNNNYLATTARADSPPYGIDYPTRRPTGRFSNGLNIPDFISKVSLSYFCRQVPFNVVHIVM
jgi:phospholipase/lecithinase/hemolysin